MAATDGTPGATSTGSFNATLTLESPPASTVQILGLRDLALGTFTIGAGGSQGGFGVGTAFCMKRSDAGNIFLTVSQTIPDGEGFFLFSGIDSNTDGISDRVPVQVYLSRLDDTSAYLANGVPSNEAPSPSACNVGTFGTAHFINVEVAQQNGLLAGSYSGTFTVLVAPA